LDTDPTIILEMAKTEPLLYVVRKTGNGSFEAFMLGIVKLCKQKPRPTKTPFAKRLIDRG
jgi:hypothetical protein